MQQTHIECLRGAEFGHGNRDLVDVDGGCSLGLLSARFSRPSIRVEVRDQYGVKSALLALGGPALVAQLAPYSHWGPWDSGHGLEDTGTGGLCLDT